MDRTFDYYNAKFKLISPMLGTATETSIYYEHILKKAQKEIEKANKISGKISKALEKYRGVELSEDKIISELQGTLRTLCQLTGRKLEVPDDVDSILKFSKELEAEFMENIKTKEDVKATVFLRNKDGWPIISTHMVLGNMKANIKAATNAGSGEDVGINQLFKSKTAIGEAMSLDITFVEDYMTPSNDILKVQPGEEAPTAPRGRNIVDSRGRVLLERPLTSFQGTSISTSEQLPVDTQFECTMRVRKGSIFGYKELAAIFDMGKAQGFGAWRGSGSMGAYVYQLKYLEEYKEDFGDWN